MGILLLIFKKGIKEIARITGNKKGQRKVIRKSKEILICFFVDLGKAGDKEGNIAKIENKTRRN